MINDKNSYIMVVRNIKLKNLNIEPLSVAKYFYKNDIEDMAIVQLMLYFLFLETLKEKNTLLFAEEWQAWPNGPAIKSVFDKMHDNRHHLDKLFKPVENLDNELVLNYADKIYKKYKNTEPYLIFEKAQNKPWKDARKPLKSERETASIGLTNLVSFTNSNGKRVRKI